MVVLYVNHGSTVWAGALLLLGNKSFNGPTRERERGKRGGREGEGGGGRGEVGEGGGGREEEEEEETQGASCEIGGGSQIWGSGRNEGCGCVKIVHEPLSAIRHRRG